MGKWTLEYHDDVLRNKMKSLVTGAVKRIRLEQGEPLISYEAFVEELDEGDSFTASIIDMLVKEMAERRTRPNPIDRRLISERTAKTLRMQAAPLHIYRNRHSLGRSASRRTFHYMDYATAHAEDTQVSDDEDEFGSVVGGNGPLEGVRMNTDLFEAYNAQDVQDGHSYPPSEPTPLATGSPDPLDARDTYGVTSPRPISPPTLPSPFRTSNPWGPYASSSSLTRQSSIRRPVRLRAGDFTDFTHRRRSSIRSLQNPEPTRLDSVRAAQNPENDQLENTSGVGSVWQFRLRDESPMQEEAPAAPPAARRFFPLSPWSQARNRREVGGAFPWSPEATEAGPSIHTADLPTAASSSTPSSSQLWYSLTASAAEASASPPAATPDVVGDGRSAPRLRRGGIRAPESLLSRHVSPASEEREVQGVSGSAAQLAGARAAGAIAEMGAPHSAVRDITPVEVANWQRTGQLSMDFLTPRSLSPVALPTVPSAEGRSSV